MASKTQARWRDLHHSQEGRNVREADWLDYVAGFTIFDDWSCRDLQRDEQAVGLVPAKGKDAATSLGPMLVDS